MDTDTMTLTDKVREIFATYYNTIDKQMGDNYATLGLAAYATDMLSFVEVAVLDVVQQESDKNLRELLDNVREGEKANLEFIQTLINATNQGTIEFHPERNK